MNHCNLKNRSPEKQDQESSKGSVKIIGETVNLVNNTAPENYQPRKYQIDLLTRKITIWSYLSS
jgi:hypothetical protein